MHHLVVKNKLVEGTTTRHGYGGGDGNHGSPVCPKPRHPRAAVPHELVKSFKCTDAHGQENLDGRSEILNMIITDKKTNEDRNSLCYYTGSPPQRTGNPLIHDVHFINQVKVFSSLASLKN